MNFFKKSSPKLKENQMSIEAMKQALEALEGADSIIWSIRGITPDDICDAITSLRQAIEQAEKQEPVAMQMDVIVVNLVREGINKHRARELAEHFIKHTTPQPQQDAWKNAAIRLGEELSSFGPDGYYDMTAEQWLSWALDQQPNGKHSLPQPQRPWVGLTPADFDWLEQVFANKVSNDFVFADIVCVISAKLKEKNT